MKKGDKQMANVNYKIVDFDAELEFFGSFGNANISFDVLKTVDGEIQESSSDEFILAIVDFDITYDEDFNGKKYYYLNDYKITNLQDIKEQYNKAYNEEMSNEVLKLINKRINNYFEAEDWDDVVRQYKEGIEEENMLSSHGY